MLNEPDANACLPANDYKALHLLLVCPAAGGRWQIHLARWQHVRGGLEGKLVFCLRPMHCAALPWPLSLTLHSPKGAMAGDRCSSRCCCCWQMGWDGGAAVSNARAPLCCQLALRHRCDLLLPIPAAATLTMPRRHLNAASACHFCSWQCPALPPSRQGLSELCHALGLWNPMLRTSRTRTQQVMKPKPSFLQQGASQCQACILAFNQPLDQQAAAKLTLLPCQLQEGAKHGLGMYRWPTGATFRGEWMNGCMHGVGTFESPDGTRYQGGWAHDLKQGLGKKTYANGDCYEVSTLVS